MDAQREVPIPWEFRITKMPKVTVRSSTGNDYYNYYHIEDGRLMTGYHGEKETSETECGELLKTGSTFTLVLDENLKSAVREQVLPNILEALAKNGTIVHVLEGEDDQFSAAA